MHWTTTGWVTKIRLFLLLCFLCSCFSSVCVERWGLKTGKSQQKMQGRCEREAGRRLLVSRKSRNWLSNPFIADWLTTHVCSVRVLLLSRWPKRSDPGRHFFSGPSFLPNSQSRYEKWAPVFFMIALLGFLSPFSLSFSPFPKFCKTVRSQLYLLCPQKVC